jgi:hypothetical protein
MGCILIVFVKILRKLIIYQWKMFIFRKKIQVYA